MSMHCFISRAFLACLFDTIASGAQPAPLQPAASWPFEILAPAALRSRRIDSLHLPRRLAYSFFPCFLHVKLDGDNTQASKAACKRCPLATQWAKGMASRDKTEKVGHRSTHGTAQRHHADRNKCIVGRTALSRALLVLPRDMPLNALRLPCLLCLLRLQIQLIALCPPGAGKGLAYAWAHASRGTAFPIWPSRLGTLHCDRGS